VVLTVSQDLDSNFLEYIEAKLPKKNIPEIEFIQRIKENDD